MAVVEPQRPIAALHYRPSGKAAIGNVIMHWRLEPIIWVLIIGTLALLAIPRPAHPVSGEASRTALADASQGASPEIRRACDGDVRRLCPKEYAARDRAGIGACMKTNWTQISAACVAAWLREHPQ